MDKIFIGIIIVEKFNDISNAKDFIVESRIYYCLSKDEAVGLGYNYAKKQYPTHKVTHVSFQELTKEELVSIKGFIEEMGV